MGDCACGEKDTLQMHVDPELVEQSDKKAEKDDEAKYISAGDRQKKCFIKGSLFEKDFGDEEGIVPEKKASYQIDWDRHLEEVTEDTLLERAPALALDMLYMIEVPDDFDSEQLSAISESLENSDLGERSMNRLVVGPLQVHLCSGAFHR